MDRTAACLLYTSHVIQALNAEVLLEYRQQDSMRTATAATIRSDARLIHILAMVPHIIEQYPVSYTHLASSAFFTLTTPSRQVFAASPPLT